jgi:DHA1 family bicyclomycin/chloramphenicol resistance-like MFS transporter
MLSTQKFQQLPLLTLTLLVSFGSVCAVILTPSLPAIGKYFAVSESQAQLTISLFLIGYALGQLIYGPLANRYGRKLAIYIGITLEIASAFLCLIATWSHWFCLLLFGRLLMALGASAGLKMSFTLIADVYEQKQASQVISFLTLTFAITPAIAVSLGGFLAEHIHWQSCFYILAVYGGLLLLFCYYLPETAPIRDTQALQITKLLRGYTTQLKNYQLMACALLAGCGTAMIYIFAERVPFIAIHRLGLSPSQYGLYNLLPPVGMIIGAIWSMWRAKPALASIGLGLIIELVGICIMLLLSWQGYTSALTIFLPIIIVYIGESLVYANAIGLATSHAKDKSYASAMLNFVNMGFSVLCVYMAGLITDLSTTLLASTFLTIILLALAIFVGLYKRAIKLAPPFP